MTLAAQQPTLSPSKTQLNQDEGDSKRRSLSAKMIRVLLYHFVDLKATALQGYTLESQKSEYLHAKAELEIFDPAGNLVFLGREFHSGMPAFWRPSCISQVAEYAANDNVPVRSLPPEFSQIEASQVTRDGGAQILEKQIW